MTSINGINSISIAAWDMNAGGNRPNDGLKAVFTQISGNPIFLLQGCGSDKHLTELLGKDASYDYRLDANNDTAVVWNTARFTHIQNGIVPSGQSATVTFLRDNKTRKVIEVASCNLKKNNLMALNAVEFAGMITYNFRPALAVDLEIIGMAADPTAAGMLSSGIKSYGFQDHVSQWVEERTGNIFSRFKNGQGTVIRPPNEMQVHVAESKTSYKFIVASYRINNSSPVARICKVIARFFKRIAYFFKKIASGISTLAKKCKKNKAAPAAQPVQQVPAAQPARETSVIVKELMTYLRGDNRLKTEGIFRIAGTAELEGLSKDIASQQVVFNDVHDAANVLKRYVGKVDFFENANCTAFLDAWEPDEAMHVANLKNLMSTINNKDLFEEIITFLADVAKFAPVNKMTAHNLAVPFAPKIFEPKQGSQTELLQYRKDSKGYASVLKLIIEHQDQLFRI